MKDKYGLIAIQRIVILLLLCLPILGWGQTIQISSQPILVKNLFKEITEKHAINFVYSDLEQELDKKVNLTKLSAPLKHLLDEVASQTNLKFSINRRDVIVKFVENDKLKEKVTFVRLSGVVKQKNESFYLGYANVTLQDALDTLKIRKTIAGSDGSFVFAQIPKGKYLISASFVGFSNAARPISVVRDTYLVLETEAVTTDLQEVFVTAEEQKGMTTSSKISRDAINLLQPSSFTDLLSLLPGGRTTAPSLTGPNLIRLREANAPTGKDYAISSLGTLFVVDDIPLSVDANLQTFGQSPVLSYVSNKEYASYGMDMRGISTDNIESVEIIRGIPSVRYGDLTSGVVKIERRLSALPLTARFKFDQSAKLFALSRGIEFNRTNWLLNFDLDLVNSRSNPIDPLETYKRYTASFRAQKTWAKGKDREWRWNLALDYTGQFDDWQLDTEQLREEESYELNYNKYSFSSRLSFRQKKHWLQTIDWNVATSYSRDHIYRERWANNANGTGIIPLSTEPGEHDAILLPREYLATGAVEGEPLNVYSTLRTLMHFDTKGFSHNVQLGAEWKLDKNLGAGQVFDLARPISNTFSARPYPYNAIPAQHQASWFLEEKIRTPQFFGNEVTAQVGVRGGTMLNLDKRYNIQGKWYTDPRINVQWQLPKVNVAGKPLVFSITGGLGWLTKMPTMELLQPDLMYVDFLQFAYDNTLKPEYSRFNIRTYVEDLRNFELDYAKNRKKEIRLDAQWNKHEFAITIFSEKTNSGFRTVNIPHTYSYKLYDKVNDFNVTAKPDLTTLGYTQYTVFGSVPRVTNGSQLTKDGVEFSFITPRYESINTRFTITGAHFVNNYQNSIPYWYRGSTGNNPIVGGFIVFANYAAYYPNWRDGYKRKNTTASFTADTYIKRLGLTMSLRSDFYFNGTNLIWDNNPGAPSSYLTTDGQLHEFTEADKSHIYRSYLVLPQIGNQVVVDGRFSMSEHLRASKDFGKWIRLSLYVNNLLNINPGYRNTIGEYLQTTKPASYFGMELRLTL